MEKKVVLPVSGIEVSVKPLNMRVIQSLAEYKVLVRDGILKYEEKISEELRSLQQMQELKEKKEKIEGIIDEYERYTTNVVRTMLENVSEFLTPRLSEDDLLQIPLPDLQFLLLNVIEISYGELTINVFDPETKYDFSFHIPIGKLLEDVERNSWNGKSYETVRHTGPVEISRNGVAIENKEIEYSVSFTNWMTSTRGVKPLSSIKYGNNIIKHTNILHYIKKNTKMLKYTIPFATISRNIIPELFLAGLSVLTGIDASKIIYIVAYDILGLEEIVPKDIKNLVSSDNGSIFTELQIWGKINDTERLLIAGYDFFAIL